jgi:hypothetical protein
MTGRGTLYLLLAVVAGAAAMLSFAALRDLAELCGFAPVLAWLLPVVVDAGAAAGSLVWLAPGTREPARRFARRLALGLLGLSVAANALGHGLAAYLLAPPWWVVVVLSGIAPAVLGAMVHLAVLVRRSADLSDGIDLQRGDDAAAVVDRDSHDEAGHEVTAVGTDGFPWTWNPAPPPYRPPVDGAPADRSAPPERDRNLAEAVLPAALAGRSGVNRAAAMIAAGAGRRRLSRELGVTEYEARRLIEQVRPAATANTTTDYHGTSPEDDDTAANNAPVGTARVDDASVAEPLTTGAAS